MLPSHFRVYSPVGDVMQEGVVGADGAAVVNQQDVVSKVVFYSGEVDGEIVCGAVEINAPCIDAVMCPIA